MFDNHNNNNSFYWSFTQYIEIKIYNSNIETNWYHQSASRHTGLPDDPENLHTKKTKYKIMAINKHVEHLAKL